MLLKYFKSYSVDLGILLINIEISTFATIADFNKIRLNGYKIKIYLNLI